MQIFLANFTCVHIRHRTPVCPSLYKTHRKFNHKINNFKLFNISINVGIQMVNHFLKSYNQKFHYPNFKIH